MTEDIQNLKKNQTNKLKMILTKDTHSNNKYFDIAQHKNAREPHLIPGRVSKGNTLENLQMKGNKSVGSILLYKLNLGIANSNPQMQVNSQYFSLMPTAGGPELKIMNTDDNRMKYSIPPQKGN